MNVGYVKVSTSSQNIENQIDQLKSAGCKKIFSEKRSGKNESNREQFEIMMDFVREGRLLFTMLGAIAKVSYSKRVYFCKCRLHYKGIN